MCVFSGPVQLVLLLPNSLQSPVTEQEGLRPPPSYNEVVVIGRPTSCEETVPHINIMKMTCINNVNGDNFDSEHTGENYPSTSKCRAL